MYTAMFYESRQKCRFQFFQVRCAHKSGDVINFTTVARTCLCSPVVTSLGRHVQLSVTFAVAEVRFEPQPGRVRLLKELFQIIPTHMMIREIIHGRKQRARADRRCPLQTVTIRL